MPIHSQLQGLELHEPYHYVQESDPGAVGVGKYWLKVSTGEVKRRNDTNVGWNLTGSGASVFTSLTDTPSTYVGQANKIPSVKADETGLEFIANSSLILPDWLKLAPDATPASPNAMDDEFNSIETLPGGSTPLWTWRNQGSATAAIRNTHLELKAPALAGDNLKILEQTCPAAPWEFTAKICPEFIAVPTNAVMGICAIGPTGKVVIMGWQEASSGKLAVFYYTSVTAVSSNPASLPTTNRTFYVRLKDDGTNFIFSHSFSGASFQVLFTASRTAFLTASATTIGLAVASEQATNYSVMTSNWFRRTL